MERLSREAGNLLIGVAFLTRLPVAPPPGDLACAVRWFPIVGALVGGIAAAVLLAAAAVLPVPVAAGLAVAAGVLATGALHEDGLADTADGLGGRDRAHALEIMRDSRTGSYGALALVFSVGLRWAALATLAPGAGAAALVAAHALGRAAIPPVLAFADYARPTGMADGVAGRVGPGDAAIAVALALVIALSLAGGAGLAGFAVAALAAGVMLASLVRRLGGYTGDGLGAVEQAAEIATLLTLAALP